MFLSKDKLSVVVESLDLSIKVSMYVIFVLSPS